MAIIGKSRKMSRAGQRRATEQTVSRMIGVTGKRFAEFADFLRDFVFELNSISGDGRVLLVEGSRDVKAMKDIGYSGNIVSIASINGRASRSKIDRADTVVIMTDLDKEGRQLAARYAKFFAHTGKGVSLDYRRRLIAASKGLFLHIENLSRFSYISTPLNKED